MGLAPHHNKEMYALTTTAPNAPFSHIINANKQPA